MKRTKLTEQNIIQLEGLLELIINYIINNFEANEKGIISFNTENYSIFLFGKDYISLNFNLMTEKGNTFYGPFIHKTSGVFNINQSVYESIDYAKELTSVYKEVQQLKLKEIE